VSRAGPNQLCTLATILPRTCPSASRSNAFGIASNVICSATVGLIFPPSTSVISSVAIRPESTSARPGLSLRSFRFFEVLFAVGVYSSCLSKASVRLLLEPTEAKWSP
jgi:hypothetical protein